MALKHGYYRAQREHAARSEWTDANVALAKARALEEATDLFHKCLIEDGE